METNDILHFLDIILNHGNNRLKVSILRKWTNKNIFITLYNTIILAHGRKEKRGEAGLR